MKEDQDLKEGRGRKKKGRIVPAGVTADRVPVDGEVRVSKSERRGGEKLLLKGEESKRIRIKARGGKGHCAKLGKEWDGGLKVLGVRKIRVVNLLRGRYKNVGDSAEKNSLEGNTAKAGADTGKEEQKGRGRSGVGWGQKVWCYRLEV